MDYNTSVVTLAKQQHTADAEEAKIEADHEERMAKLEIERQERLIKVQAEAEEITAKAQVELIRTRAEHVETELMLLSEQNKAIALQTASRTQLATRAIIGGVVSVTILGFFGLIGVVCGS